MTPEAEAVLAVLERHPEGMKYERLRRAICDWAGNPAERRTVEAAVQELRLAGHPILSGSEGVRLARNAEEAAACAAALRRRAVTQLLTARAVRRAARRMREAEEHVEPLRLWDVAS